MLGRFLSPRSRRLPAGWSTAVFCNCIKQRCDMGRTAVDTHKIGYLDEIDGHDRICQVVELAMMGAAQGSVAKLKKAFHKQARMFGEVHGTRYDEPIAAFFELCKKHPLGKGRRYRSRIISVT